MYQTVSGQTNSAQALPQQDPVNKSVVKEEEQCMTCSQINADFFNSVAVHLLNLCNTCNYSRTTYLYRSPGSICYSNNTQLQTSLYIRHLSSFDGGREKTRNEQDLTQLGGNVTHINNGEANQS